MMNDLAYIAGFWEGEGHVGIYDCFYDTTHKKGRKRLEVGISNTNRDVLEWIKKKFNNGCVKKKSKGKPNWKQGYVWIARDGSAMKFLKAIYPYLKFRNKEVKALIMGDLSPLF